jgi:hypothetical protein
MLIYIVTCSFNVCHTNFIRTVTKSVRSTSCCHLVKRPDAQGIFVVMKLVSYVQYLKMICTSEFN